MEPLRVFISYSSKDTKWRESIETCLAVLQQQQVITVWHNDKILPGSVWNAEIQKKLNEADIILFLVSANLLASEYFNDTELPRAMERLEEGVIVIPIILRSCDWRNMLFGQLQALPRGGQPIGNCNNDEVFNDIAQGIRQVCQENLCVNQTICSEDRKYRGELVSIELLCYTRLVDVSNLSPNLSIGLNIAFGEVTEAVRYGGKDCCIRFGLKRGKLCLSLSGGDMPMNQMYLQADPQQEWDIQTMGAPKSPIWKFEAVSQSALLKGSRIDQKLGTVNLLNQHQPCRVEVIFRVEIIYNDLEIIDQYGLWETNSTPIDIQTITRAFFKRTVKPKLEDYLNKLVLEYDCNSPIDS